MNLIVAVLVGVATWYGPGFYGQPLGCHWCLEGNQYFEPGPTPWIAVDIDRYGKGGWRCNDLIELQFEGEPALWAFLQDAGDLERHWVSTWPHTPIVADIPEYFWPFPLDTRAAKVIVINHSLAARIRAAEETPNEATIPRGVGTRPVAFRRVASRGRGYHQRAP